MTPTTEALASVLEQLISPEQAAAWAGPLRTAAELADLNTPLRLAHFLAQTLHETNAFTVLEENLNYSAQGLLATWPGRFTPQSAAEYARRPEQIANLVYAGRLGNTQPGDGWRFRGRGLIQLTGRAHYAALADELEEPLILHQPELLADPPLAALSAAWYWRRAGVNEYADRDDLEGVTRRVNGGLIGLEERRAWYERAARAIATAHTPEPPERLGAHTRLVLHDLTEADHRALMRAWLDGHRSVTLEGSWAATRTPSSAGAKLDVRKEPA